MLKGTASELQGHLLIGGLGSRRVSVYVTGRENVSYVKGVRACVRGLFVRGVFVLVFGLMDGDCISCSSYLCWHRGRSRGKVNLSGNKDNKIQL